MYNDDMIWINQPIFKYVDNDCGTSSTIELSILTRTSDNISFSPIELSIRITSKKSNTTHICTLNYQHIYSLISAISEIVKNPDLSYDQNAKIVRRVNSTKDLVLMCALNDKGKYILIGIKNNENDSGKIIISYDTFLAIYDLLQDLKRNYIQLSINLPTRLPDQNIISNLISIERAIRLLPSNLNLPSNPIIENREEEKEVNLPATLEFEKFVEDNIDKAKIPEMEVIINELSTSTTSLDPPQQEFNSPFIYKVLNNKIKNYEAIINSIYHEANNPTLKFIEIIKSQMNIDDFLPGITKTELKSLGYISKVFFKSLFKKYLEYGEPIPSTSPALIRYKPTSISTENIEFAYDLILINVYIKCVRTQLAGKITDSVSNNSVLHIASRCFTDILAFSFICDLNHDIVKNCIISRYKSYKEKGFFHFFEDILNVNSCNQITDQDIQTIVELALKSLSSTETISELHNKAFQMGKLKIPSENKFDVEQMSNEIVDLEVNRHLGKPLEDVSNNEELIVLFKKETNINKKAPTFKTTFESNLHRFSKESDFVNQIPERHKQMFEDYILEISVNSEPFDYTKIPLEELGDDIVKAIYVWNTCDRKERYTSYRSRIEECMSKDFVIAQVKGIAQIEDTTGSEDGKWV